MANRLWMFIRETAYMHIVSLLIVTVVIQVRMGIMFDPYSYTTIAEAFRSIVLEIGVSRAGKAAEIYPYIDLTWRFIEYQYDIIFFTGLAIGAVYSITFTRWLNQGNVKTDLLLPVRRRDVLLSKFTACLVITTMPIPIIYAWNIWIRYGSINLSWLLPSTTFLVHLLLINSAALFISISSKNELITFFTPVLLHWLIIDQIMVALFENNVLRAANHLHPLYLSGKYSEYREVIENILGTKEIPILPLFEEDFIANSILFTWLFLLLISISLIILSIMWFSRGDYD